MKRLLTVGVMLLGLAGCGDGLTNREETCLEYGGTFSECTSEGRAQERAMASIENGHGAMRGGDNFDYDQASYPPVERGQNYTNYYGDTSHGYWGSNGQFRFNDPYSRYASSTNSFLLGAGIGGIAGYLGTKAAMRSTWNTDNPKGYTTKSYKADKNLSKSGKVISKKEVAKRKAQSKKDRKSFYKKKLKNDKKKLKASKKKVAKANKKSKNSYKNKSKNKNNNKFTKKAKSTKSSYSKPKKSYSKKKSSKRKSRSSKKKSK